MEWDAPADFNLASTVDSSIVLDEYTSPYKLTFTMPSAPLVFDRVVLDLNGSRLNPSCVDGVNPSYLYPLFARIRVMLDFNNDVFYDEICPFVSKEDDAIGDKTLVLSRPLSYRSTSNTIILLLFPSLACTQTPHKIVLNKISFESPSTPPSTTIAPPPTTASPSSSTNTTLVPILVMSLSILIFFLIYYFITHHNT